MARRIRRWLIRLAFWTLQKCIRYELRTVSKSVGMGLLEGSDPCQLQIDAVASTMAQISPLVTLLQMQVQALEQCRINNPGSDPGPL